MEAVTKEIIKTYHATYEGEPKVEANFSSGKYTFHKQRLLLKTDDYRFSVNISASGGASQTTDPIRIILYHNTPTSVRLEISPKSFFRKKLAMLLSSTNITLAIFFKKKFDIKGDQHLIDSILNDAILLELFNHLRIYIIIDPKYPKQIMLTPERGIESMQHFNNYIEILERIANLLS